MLRVAEQKAPGRAYRPAGSRATGTHHTQPGGPDAAGHLEVTPRRWADSTDRAFTGSRARPPGRRAASPLDRNAIAANPLYYWHGACGVKAVLVLAIRAGKYKLVVIDHPVRAVTVPAGEARHLRPIVSGRRVVGLVRQFRRIGRANGMAKAAEATLRRIDQAGRAATDSENEQ